MNKLLYTLLLAAALWLAGCTPYQSTLTNEERTYPATTAATVQIFLHGETVPPSTEVGTIVVLGKSVEDGIEYLQKKAAEMGADGVTNVEVKIQTQTFFILVIPVPVSSYFVSGSAVKFIKS